MSQKIFYLEDVGSVTVNKRRGKKNISISIKAFKGIQVSIPFYVSYNKALSFVTQKKDWIQKSLNKIEQLENKQTIFYPESEFLTRNHKIVFLQESRERFYTNIAEEIITVKIPEKYDFNSEIVQNVIRKIVEKVWLLEAQELIPVRLNYFSEKFELPFKSLKINKTKSKWGSCSYYNDISISLYVMQLPDYLIDSILLHELSHTKVKNHQKEFWQLFLKFDPQTKINTKKIKLYKPGVF